MERQIAGSDCCQCLTLWQKKRRMHSELSETASWCDRSRRQRSSQGQASVRLSGPASIECFYYSQQWRRDDILQKNNNIYLKKNAAQRRARPAVADVEVMSCALFHSLPLLSFFEALLRCTLAHGRPVWKNQINIQSTQTSEKKWTDRLDDCFDQNWERKVLLKFSIRTLWKIIWSYPGLRISWILPQVNNNESI